MARVDTEVSVCSCLTSPGRLPCGWPFSLVQTLDEHLGLTDALVRCNNCAEYYLLELTQWPTTTTDLRVMRLLSVTAANAERFLANVNRDYCDLQRHQHELAALQVGARLSAWLLTLDVANHRLVATNKYADSAPVELVSWRQREF